MIALVTFAEDVALFVVAFSMVAALSGLIYFTGSKL